MSVYFATARDIGTVKIGYAKNIKSRLKALQTGCPAKIEIEAEIEGGQPLEAELHQIFRPWRRHGEWFELSPVIEMAIHWARSGEDIPADPAAYHSRFLVDYFRHLQGRAA